MQNSNDLIVSGFVRLDRKYMYALNKLAADRLISFKEYRLAILFISETISWKLGTNGKPSNNPDAKRSDTCKLSYSDIENRLFIKDNIARSIKKLIGLGIICAVKPANNRDKVTYFFQTDTLKWKTKDNDVILHYYDTNTNNRELENDLDEL